MQKPNHGHWPNRFFLLLLTLLLTIQAGQVLLVTPEAAAATIHKLQAAPVNPTYLAYLQDQARGKVAARDESGRTLGYAPGPWQAPELTVATDTQARAFALPATYDLRSLNRVTPVRDQDTSGSCWTFATYGSLESALLPGTSTDFSENNLKNTHGFDYDPNTGGGNAWMATAYVGRWSGPVNEALDPYDPASTSSPAGLAVSRHIQDVTFLPADITAIKQAIYDGGALYTAFFWDIGNFNDTYDSYYCSTDNNANHAVTIVGWIDSFPASQFNSAPAGNGAFIVKNSWNTTWGDNGYFYLSFYDASALAENAAFHWAEPVDNYSQIFQYDPLGAVNFLGTEQESLLAANVFTAGSSQALEAVSFYTPTTSSTYTIRIYTDLSGATPDTGTLALTDNGSLSQAGYHTLPLSTSVPLAAGQTFAIAINLTTPDYIYPQAIEYAIDGFSSQATAASGQSYFCMDGVNWVDLTSDFDPSANFCIKALTNPLADCTLAYNGNGQTSGTVPAGGTFAYNTLVTVAGPGDLVRTDYTFTGWNTQADGSGQAYSAGDTFALRLNTTLYAQWRNSSDLLTVTFDPQNETSPFAVTTGYGTLISKPANPTREGYKFVAWYTDTGYTAAWNFSTDLVKSDRTLYARWIINALGNVTARSGGYNSIRLTWAAEPGADFYSIYRSTTSSTEGFSRIKTDAAGSSFTDEDLATNTRYYYKIKAYAVVDGTRISSPNFSAVVSARPVPARPGSFAVANAGYNSIRISWQAVSGASGYKLYRATSENGSYSLIKTVSGASTVSYTDTGLTTGKSYYYKLRAYRTVSGSAVYSSYTAILSKEPLPATPSGLSLTRAGATSLKISWRAVSGATGYQMYRSSSENGSYSKIKTTSSTSYTNTGLTTGQSYYYKVRAYRTVSGKNYFGSFTAVKGLDARESYAPECAVNLPEDTVSDCTAVVIYFANNGVRPLRIYSANAALIDADFADYDRNLLLCDEEGYLLDYIELAAGSAAYINFLVDGDATWYDANSTIAFDFRYDLVAYRAYCCANDGSYYVKK